MRYYALRYEIKNGGHVLALVVVVGSADHKHTYTRLPPWLSSKESACNAGVVTGVRSPSQEDPLEGSMANHSSILAWRIPCTEEPGGLPSTALQRNGHD